MTWDFNTILFVISVLGNIGMGVERWIKGRREIRKDIITEYESILDKYKGAADRHEVQLQNHESVIRELAEHCHACDVEFTMFYGYLERMHDLAKRMAYHIETLGGKPESIPDLPMRSQRTTPGAEYLARTAQQVQNFMKAVDNKKSSSESQT